MAKFIIGVLIAVILTMAVIYTISYSSFTATCQGAGGTVQGTECKAP